MLPRRRKHSHVFLWHWILSVVYLQPWLIRNRQCGAVSPTYPTLILILPAFFFSFRSRNFILPLSRHWSPSFEPGLVSLAACCLNTPRAAGGPTMNQSLWGTSELTAVTSSQGLFFQVLIFLLFLFVCHDRWQSESFVSLCSRLFFSSLGVESIGKGSHPLFRVAVRNLYKHFLYSWRFCSLCHDESKDRMVVQSLNAPYNDAKLE